MSDQNIKARARSKGFFYGWAIIIACFFNVFTMMASYYSFGVFFKPISGEFGWNRAQTSLVISINLMTGAFMGIVVGRLVDKYKPRNIMLACSALAGLTYILMSGITGLAQFYILYGVVLGMAMSANYVIPAVLINRWFIKKRGLGLGIVFSAFGMAQMISPPLAATLIDSVGWRQMYIYMGLLVFVIIAVCALFLRSSPQEMGLLPDGNSDQSSVEGALSARDLKKNTVQGLTVKETLHTPTFWLISLLWLFMAFPVYMIVVHLIPYSTDMGINVIAAASIMTVAGISNIVGRISLGHISDKFGSKMILLSSFVMVIFGLLLLINARNLMTFYLAAALVNLFLNGGDTVVIKVLGDLFGVKSLGFIVGATSLAWRIGASSGTYLAGLFFDATDSYAAIFAFAALAMYICFILSIFIFKKKPSLSPVSS